MIAAQTIRQHAIFIPPPSTGVVPCNKDMSGASSLALQMRSLQRRDAARRKRSHAVPLRLAYSDQDSKKDDAILLNGLEGRLRNEGTPAALEILANLKKRVLPVIEAVLDAVVIEAYAEEDVLVAKGPLCLLHTRQQGWSRSVEVRVDSRSVHKGEKRKTQ